VRPIAHLLGATVLTAALLFGARATLGSAEEDASPSAAELMDALMWKHGPIGGPLRPD